MSLLHRLHRAFFVTYWGMLCVAMIVIMTLATPYFCWRHEWLAAATAFILLVSWLISYRYHRLQRNITALSPDQLKVYEFLDRIRKDEENRKTEKRKDTAL